MCLAVKSDKKNIVIASDKQISSSMEETLAILQHAPPFPILDCWEFADHIRLSHALVLSLTQLVGFSIFTVP